MESKLIECKSIDVPKASPHKRTFTKEFAVRLADSIKIDGQLVPIVVRPNPDAPGRYILVAGKHRLYAMKNVLKEQFIAAQISEEMDAEDAEFAGTVENLFRNPLAKAQHALAMKEWYERWMAKHAPKGEKGDEAATAMADAEQPAAEPTAGPIDTVEPAPEPSAPAAPAPKDSLGRTKREPLERRFNETVAAATGQSITSTKETKRIANAFTKDQLEIFAQMGAKQADMEMVAKVKDEVKRGEIVNLIAAGMSAADATKEVMKDAAPTRKNSGTKAERETKAASAKETAPDMTDDEWFDRHCGEKARMLKNPAKFKADALLFRAVSDLRHAFRSKAKKVVQATRRASVFGGFTNLVTRFINISHPKDWQICGECKGQGEVANPATEQQVAAFGGGYAKKQCPKCFGGGYMLKTEEYL